MADLRTILDLPLDRLVRHPRNRDYFRPLAGDDWQLFLHDVAERGVVEPLVVTPQADDLYRIVSGHNRLAAATELALATVPCLVEHYRTPDDEIADLIRSNVHRRQLDPFTKVRLAAVLIADKPDRRAQNGDKGGQNDGFVAPDREKPRDQVARELAMHPRDVAVARLFAGLPEEAKERLAAWAEANDPNKTQLRERIRTVTAELSDVKRRERRLRKRNKALESLEHQRAAIEADQHKLTLWRELSNHDARIAGEAARVHATVTDMREWFQSHVTEIAYTTIDPAAITLVEPQVQDLVRMLTDLRGLIIERYLDRVRDQHTQKERSGAEPFDEGQS